MSSFEIISITLTIVQIAATISIGFLIYLLQLKKQLSDKFEKTFDERNEISKEVMVGGWAINEAHIVLSDFLKSEDEYLPTEKLPESETDVSALEKCFNKNRVSEIFIKKYLKSIENFYDLHYGLFNLLPEMGREKGIDRETAKGFYDEADTYLADFQHLDLFMYLENTLYTNKKKEPRKKKSKKSKRTKYFS